MRATYFLNMVAGEEEAEAETKTQQGWRGDEVVIRNGEEMSLVEAE